MKTTINCWRFDKHIERSVVSLVFMVPALTKNSEWICPTDLSCMAFMMGKIVVSPRDGLTFGTHWCVVIHGRREVRLWISYPWEKDIILLGLSIWAQCNQRSMALSGWRGREPRARDSLWKLEEVSKWVLLECLQREHSATWWNSYWNYEMLVCAVWSFYVYDDVIQQQGGTNIPFWACIHFVPLKSQ